MGRHLLNDVLYLNKILGTLTAIIEGVFLAILQSWSGYRVALKEIDWNGLSERIQLLAWRLDYWLKSTSFYVQVDLPIELKLRESTGTAKLMFFTNIDYHYA